MALLSGLNGITRKIHEHLQKTNGVAENNLRGFPNHLNVSANPSAGARSSRVWTVKRRLVKTQCILDPPFSRWEARQRTYSRARSHLESWRSTLALKVSGRVLASLSGRGPPGGYSQELRSALVAGSSTGKLFVFLDTA